MTWLGTVRGRLGTSLGGTLFYGTAGLAFGNVKNHIDLGRATDSYNLLVPHTIATRATEHLFRGGLNDHFAMPAAARY